MVSRRSIALAGIVAAIVMCASCLSVLLARSATAISPVAQIEVAAPDFTLMDTSGEPVSLRKYRGQVVVVFFTDPRCPVSNAYSGRILALARRYADQPVQLLAIASGANVREPTYVKELCVQRRILGEEFPTLLDPDGHVATRFGATVTPSFYVIGRHGLLRYAGAFDDNQDETKAKRSYVIEAIDAALAYGTPQIGETPAVGSPIAR